MKIFLIANNKDTVDGLALCGIKGIAVYENEEFIIRFKHAVADRETGIILVTENFYKENEALINDVKLNKPLPLVVGIPEKKGTVKNKDYITEYIKSAIGVKL